MLVFTVSPAAGTRPAPAPRAFFTVTVNVWLSPTSLVASGAIVMLASTHVFTAGPEVPAVRSVLRVSGRRLTDSVVCALTVVVPAVEETSVIVQLPVPPEVVHGFGVVKPPGPLSIVKLIDVPSGAFTNPLPLFTVTCAVK